MSTTAPLPEGPGMRTAARSAPARGGYAAWVRWLEAFGRGEDPSTDGLGPVRGGFGSYVEARLLERLSTVFVQRVRQWQAALGDRIVARPPDGPAAAAAILQEATVGLGALTRLADSPLVPRAVAESMHAMLRAVREGARGALEEAWRRESQDEHAPGLPPQRVVDPVHRPRVGTRAGAPPRPRPSGPGTSRG